MNLKQAKSLKLGDIVHWTGEAPCGSTKRTVVRYRVTGQTKTWKRSPEKIRIPIKHGLYKNWYIDENSLEHWHREDECPLLLERFETDSDAELDDDQTPTEDDVAVIPSFVDKNLSYTIDLTDGSYLISNDIVEDEPEQGISKCVLTSDMIEYIAAQEEIPGSELQKTCRNLVKMHRFVQNTFTGKTFMVTFPKNERILLSAMLGSWCATL